MDIECPHCGTKHTAAQGDFGKTVKCLACSRQFAVNHGFVCAKDGVVTWYDSCQLSKMKQWSDAGVLAIIVGCGFLVWSDIIDTSEKIQMGLVLTDIEFIIEFLLAFIINLIKSLLNWQGIIGLILLVTGLLLLAMSKTRCSQCSEHDSLMDLNLPMGWKLYVETHTEEKEPYVTQRNNHVAIKNDEATESVDDLMNSTIRNFPSHDAIVMFVNLMLYKGLSEDIGEIRIADINNVFNIKYLTGNSLDDGVVPDAQFAAPIMARIKQLAGLTSAEDQPSEQRGSIKLSHEGRPVTVLVRYCEFIGGDKSVVLKIIRG